MISILHSLWSQRYFKYIISQESFITITALVRFLQIENTQLLMWHKILLFCEIQCHSGYIDMVSFQLFPNIIFKNTDISDIAVTMATLIWIFSSVYTQMVFNMSTILWKIFHHSCINMAFPVWVLWYILLDCLIVKAFTLAANIYMASPQCEFSDVYQDSFLLQKLHHTG